MNQIRSSFNLAGVGVEQPHVVEQLMGYDPHCVLGPGAGQVRCRNSMSKGKEQERKDQELKQRVGAGGARSGGKTGGRSRRGKIRS